MTATTPAIEVTAPIGSTALGCGSLEGGTTKGPAIRARATMGRLTMKMDPQLKCSSSQPPRVGPMATPRPETADHMAMALARSAGTVNTLVRIESVAGITAAA